MRITVMQLIASLLVAGITVSARAQILLDTDFTAGQAGAGLAEPWVLEEGEARVAEDGLILRNSGTDGFAVRGLAAGDADWADYRVDIEARLDEAGEDWRDGLWVGLRYAHGLNAYVVGFYASRIYVYKVMLGESVTGSTPVAQLERQGVGLRDGQWHRVAVATRGNRLNVDIDGQEVLAWQDDRAGGLPGIRSGRIALGARKWSGSKTNTQVRIRKVTVQALGDQPRAADQHLPPDRIEPWHQREVWMRYPEILATLNRWAEQYPAWVDVEEVGRTLEGEPIVVARITEKSVVDDDKHLVLVTAFDSGWERSGTAGILMSMQWLLRGSPFARKVLNHYSLIFMPVPNPWGYREHEAKNSKGINPYHGGVGRADAWDIPNLKLKDPDSAPHLAAIKSVVDRFRPDFHLDMHGVGLDYAGQLVQPAAGSAYSNCSNRPWDWRVLEHALAYAAAQGFGFCRMEVDAQKLFYGEPMKSWPQRYWLGRPLFYTANYGYTRFHTMPCTVEVAWPQSGVELLKGFLDYGLESCEQDPVPGFPVNRVCYWVGNYAVSAYGPTAIERRESRCELWGRQEELGLGFLYPYTDGRELVLCTLGAQPLQTLRGKRSGDGVAVLDLIEHLETIKDVDREPLEAFLLSAPQRRIAMQTPSLDIPFKPLEHGLAIEFPIFYREVELLDLRLNGRLIEKDNLDGYQVWYDRHDQQTRVRVNVPAEKANRWKVLIVSTHYRPNRQRAYTFERREE